MGISKALVFVAAIISICSCGKRDIETVKGAGGIEWRIEKQDAEYLKQIKAPVVTGVPLADARRDICVMRNGEIRSYGPLEDYYLSSTDCGQSWKRRPVKGTMGSCAYIPSRKIWVKCDTTPDSAPEEANGTWFLVSKKGPDDAHPRRIKVSDSVYNCSFLPSVTSSGRIFFTAQTRDVSTRGVFCYTDNGRRFKCVVMPAIPPQKVVYPHKGVRWSVGSGTEPVVCEISKDTLMMLLRNSQDCFYQAFSYDDGTTWTEPEPSPFQGTNTTPFLLRLSDGRILAFWNNTRPLPELDHRFQSNTRPSIIDGRQEDFFTNRDAAHAAISEDGGKTWIGARELLLNEIRDRADFRYFATRRTSNDKSIHQFQAIELPYGKVLVALGQNESSRRTLIFDPEWLYEKEREETFFEGLVNVSTQVYLKSDPGHTPDNGHCAYNRTHGATMMPDPEGSRRDVVQICRIADSRLLNGTQGLVWNFPAARKGEVELEMYMAEDEANISLSDCWFNPSDRTAPEFALFSFHIDGFTMARRLWHTVKLSYDLEERICTMSVDGRQVATSRLKRDAHIGLSYINVQCAASGVSDGLYLRRLSAKGQ